MEETALFRALASADRQILLYTLVNTDGTVTEEELSREVAARRHDISPETISEEKIERAHLRLVHQHLPLLRDLDLIKRGDGTAELSNDTCKDQLLEAADRMEVWPPDTLLQ